MMSGGDWLAYIKLQNRASVGARSERVFTKRCREHLLNALLASIETTTKSVWETFLRVSSVVS